jgi:hypothetical protein
MRLTRFARSAGSLLALAGLAGTLFWASRALLVALGTAEWVASATGVGAALPPVLAVSDAYTPLGNSSRTAELRELPVGAFLADAALAGAVGGAVGYAGGRLFLSADASSLSQLVVVSTAVVAGYATFVGRNLEVYGTDRPDAVEEEFRT